MLRNRLISWQSFLNVAASIILVCTHFVFAQQAVTSTSSSNLRTLINVIPVNDDDFLGKPEGSFSSDNEMLVTIANNQGRLGQGGLVGLWSIREARNLCRWVTYGKEVNGYYEGDYPVRVSFVPGSKSEFTVYSNCRAPSFNCKVEWSAAKCGQQMPAAIPANMQYALSSSENDSGERTYYDVLADTFAIGYSIDQHGHFHDYGIYNMFSGERLASLGDSLISKSRAAISSDGRFVITSGESVMGKTHRDSVMYVFDTSVSKVLSEIGTRSQFMAICSSDAVLAVYDDKSRQTVVFDLFTGKEIQALGDQSGRPLLYSRDGALLATISERGICLWAK